MKRTPEIIVALDVPTLQEADALVSELGPLGCKFKVGMQLCTARGVTNVVDFVHSRGGELFLDLKFNDIPNTVGAAVKAASELGVWMTNVHSSCGEVAMAKAVENRDKTLVTAVTVLTSLDNSTCMGIFGRSLVTQVSLFTSMAKKAGVQGIVCSAHEVRNIKTTHGRDFLTVVPGIRPAYANQDDQARVATPACAAEVGADYLVIGRAITKPPDKIGSPANAYKAIQAEMEGAVA